MKTKAILPLFLILSVLAAGGCSKLTRKSRLMSRAENDVQAGKYDTAELEFIAALKLAPLDPVTIRELGVLYFEEGRLIQAYAFLKKSAELEPKNSDIQVKLALFNQFAGRTADARAAAKKVLETDPSNEEAVMLLVTTGPAKSDLEETRTILSGLIQKKDRACDHVGLGTLLLLQRDNAGAEAEFKKALALDPKSGSAYFELGNLHFLRHELKESGAAYKSAADLSPLRSTRRIRYIEFEIGNGAAADGKKQLEELNEKAPDFVPGLVYAMRYAFEERRFDDCAAAIQKVLTRDSRNLEALVQSGTLDMAKRDAAAAITVLERAEGIYARSPEIKYELALAHIERGESSRAETSLQQAVRLAPNYDPAVLLLADMGIRKGEPDPAIDSLTRLIQARPQQVRAYLLLARAYQAKKSPEQAIAILRKVQSLDPKDPQIPYLIGMALSGQGKDEEARQAFEQSVSLSSDYPSALEMLVNDDLANHRYTAANQRVDALIQQLPKSTMPWLLRAKVHVAVRDLPGAEADLQKAIEIDPKSATAYLLLTRIYMATKNSQQAIAELTALADKTNSSRAVMQLAVIHTQLKDYEAARKDYERLLTIDPKFMPALNNLAVLYCENLKQLDKAEMYAKQAHDLRPEDGSVADTLGWIAFWKGDYRNALALIEEAAEKNPSDSDVQYHLGMAHYMLGEEEPARAALQQVAAATLASPSKDQASLRLETLAIDPAVSSATIVKDLETELAAVPNDPIARSRLASIQARQGQAKQAADNFELALKAAPHNVQIMTSLAELDAGPLQNPARARELAKSAHEIAQSDPSISAMLGRILYKTGDYAWSATLLEGASRALSNQPDLQCDLALAQYAAGKVSDAEDTLGALLKTDAVFTRRSEADQLFAMIAASKDPSQAEAALPEARNILAANPASVPALMVTGLAAEKRADYDSARQTYEKLLAADPVFSPASRQLALLYIAHLNDDQKGYDLALKVRSAFPSDPGLARAIGIVLYRKGDYAGASRNFLDILRGNYGDAEALYYSGLCHYYLKQSTTAKSELDRALALKLPNPEVEEAKRILEQISGNTSAPALSSQPIN